MTVWRTHARWFAMLRQVTTILLVQDGVSLGSSDHWVASRNSLTATESRKSSFGFQLQTSDSKSFALNEVEDASLYVNILPFAMLHAMSVHKQCLFEGNFVFFQARASALYFLQPKQWPTQLWPTMPWAQAQLLGSWPQPHSCSWWRQGLASSMVAWCVTPTSSTPWWWAWSPWESSHWLGWCLAFHGPSVTMVPPDSACSLATLTTVCGWVWTWRCGATLVFQVLCSLPSRWPLPSFLLQSFPARWWSACVSVLTASCLLCGPFWSTHLCATGFGALAAGLVRWELWTLRVELWFTSAPVCPALLPVASLDHAGTWRRIWALPTSLSWSWVAAYFGSAGWDSTAVLLCPSQMELQPVRWPPLLWLQPHPCWHGWPLSESWRARLPVSVHLLVLLQARCGGGRDVFHGFSIVFTDPQFHCRLKANATQCPKLDHVVLAMRVFWCVLLELIVQFCKCVSSVSEDFVGSQKFPVQEVLVKWSIQVWCASHLQPDLWHPAGALPSVPWELLGVSPLWSWWIGSTWWMTLLMRSACMVRVASQVPSWPAFLQWKMASSTAVALSCWASRLPVPWLAWLSLLWALPSLSESWSCCWSCAFQRTKRLVVLISTLTVRATTAPWSSTPRLQTCPSKPLTPSEVTPLVNFRSLNHSGWIRACSQGWTEFRFACFRIDRAFLQSYHVLSCPIYTRTEEKLSELALSQLLHCKTRFLHTGSLGTIWNNFGTHIMVKLHTRETSYRDSWGRLESVRPVGDRLPGTTHEPRSTRRAKKSSVAKPQRMPKIRSRKLKIVGLHDASWLSGFSWNSTYRDASSRRSKHTLAAVFTLSRCVWFEVCPVFETTYLFLL